MKTKYKQSVYCTFSVDGTHNWSDIPDTPELQDVQMLKLRHRHRFYFKCYAYVLHGNRALEFIQLQRTYTSYINKYYDNNTRTCEFGSQSCEMLGVELLEHFPELYKVEVNEDNENGSIVERNNNE